MTANGCGTHGRWKSGCPACQTMSRMYDRRRRSAIADGTWLHAVDASDVQAHIAKLIDAGMPLSAIAKAARLSRSTVLGVRLRQWVQGPTAEALFAVKPQPTEPVLPAGMVPVIGACRRVQALSWMGWSLQGQADRVGMYLQQVWQISRAKQSAVTAATDKTFRDLFEQLSATRGPSTRTHNLAVRNGWVPPLAWDDIDDLLEQPNRGADLDAVVDEVAVARAVKGEKLRLTEAEEVEALRLGVHQGEPLSVVSNRLGINYAGARQMLAGELTPRRSQQLRVEAELARAGHVHNDSTIAALTGVHHQTVTRARRRIAKRQEQLAS